MPGGIERKQSVYSKLRDEITSLKYKPGEELDMNEIAGRLGVSRSPVRDALIRL
ncbi:GntR family transcriptional regulator, partial [Treponema saccharophilum]|uniref:GntR family transcriptional regulator n=1 Tax=Treponema saccharophilum TaxID=165 RepID=UPI00386FA2BF